MNLLVPEFNTAELFGALWVLDMDLSQGDAPWWDIANHSEQNAPTPDTETGTGA